MKINYTNLLLVICSLLLISIIFIKYLLDVIHYIINYRILFYLKTPLKEYWIANNSIYYHIKLYRINNDDKIYFENNILSYQDKKNIISEQFQYCLIYVVISEQLVQPFNHFSIDYINKDHIIDKINIDSKKYLNIYILISTLWIVSIKELQFLNNFKIEHNTILDNPEIIEKKDEITIIDFSSIRNCIAYSVDHEGKTYPIYIYQFLKKDYSIQEYYNYLTSKNIYDCNNFKCITSYMCDEYVYVILIQQYANEKPIEKQRPTEYLRFHKCDDIDIYFKFMDNIIIYNVINKLYYKKNS